MFKDPRKLIWMYSEKHPRSTTFRKVLTISSLYRFAKTIFRAIAVKLIWGFVELLGRELVKDALRLRRQVARYVTEFEHVYASTDTDVGRIIELFATFFCTAHTTTKLMVLIALIACLVQCLANFARSLGLRVVQEEGR